MRASASSFRSVADDTEIFTYAWADVAGKPVGVVQIAHGLAENRPSNLLGRFANPEEVANLCVYAASPQASAITGAALRVDGGTVGTIA